MVGKSVIIEDQKVNIMVNRRNIDFLKNNGYKEACLGKRIDVGIDGLTKGSHSKVDVRCDYCGNIVKVVYKDYLNYKFDKYSCQKCRQRKTSEYNLKERQEDLYRRANSFCQEKGYELITNKEELLTSSTVVSYICPKHGEHQVKVYSLIVGHGCPKCAIEENTKAQRKDPKDVYDAFLEYGGVLLNMEEYKGWNYKNLRVLCKECGNEFLTSYSSFMMHNGQLCPECTDMMSKGERMVKEVLDSLNIEYQMQYRFYDCRTTCPLPFDFYIPNINTCIEYDGEGHYLPISHNKDIDGETVLKKIQERDAIKTAYCFNNGIRLIRIPYWEYDNIEKILNEKIFA